MEAPPCAGAWRCGGAQRWCASLSHHSPRLSMLPTSSGKLMHRCQLCYCNEQSFAGSALRDVSSLCPWSDSGASLSSLMAPAGPARRPFGRWSPHRPLQRPQTQTPPPPLTLEQKLCRPRSRSPSCSPPAADPRFGGLMWSGTCSWPQPASSRAAGPGNSTPRTPQTDWRAPLARTCPRCSCEVPHGDAHLGLLRSFLAVQAASSTCDVPVRTRCHGTRAQQPPTIGFPAHCSSAARMQQAVQACCISPPKFPADLVAFGPAYRQAASMQCMAGRMLLPP